ncbi:hypothetical protein JTE90_024629 [Oedothorax gibbosus]|uniref:SET domain-containing protein n=1 Tax=Oedothorax gibbosus TaxID=931172 RepID=A0AAV6U2X6_9ARAC|nr:hypothetical protein JTE90_024629 [Oedothorax gibbosus]
MRFCGKNCQKTAWIDHKFECPYLRNYKDFSHQPYVHMIGNIILKLKGKDWKTVTKNIFGKEVSFYDIVSHATDKGQLNMIVDAQGIEEPLKSYIGSKNMPDKATILELFGKHQKSTSSASDGWALYIGTSKLDHSCIPNAAFDLYGGEITVRAIKSIKKRQQVTISYRPLLTSTEAFLLHKGLRESWKNCYCSDCSQEFGQSDLTKILDMTRASDALEESDCTLVMMSLLARLKYPVEDIVTCDRLKGILRTQEGVLGRTNLLRMLMLARLHFRDGSCEERIAGLVELAESMKQVWGEYYGELIPVYKKLICVYMEARNLERAINYTRKVLMVEKISCGKPFDDSDKALAEKMLKFVINEFTPELLYE